MFDGLTRRGLLARLLAGLLALLRPAGAAAAPPACPHPAHQPLCADRPGRGLWYRTLLRLPCPRCGAEIQHRGYLPGTVDVGCTLVVPPGSPGPEPPLTRVMSCSYDTVRITTYAYDAAGRLLSCEERGPG